MAAMTQSAGSAAAAMTAAGPAAASDAGAGERRPQLCDKRAGSPITARRARVRARRLRQRRDIALRGERDDLEGLRVALHEVERALADGAGGAEHRQRAARHAGAVGRRDGGAQRSSPSPLAGLCAVLASRRRTSRARAGACGSMASASSAAATAAATMLSMRSMKPPWPGMRSLASLRLNSRFSANSARSPACATSASADAEEDEPQGRDLGLEHGEDGGGGGAGGERAAEAGPRLVGRHARPQLGAADAAPGGVGGGVGRPDDGEDEQHGGEAEGLVAAQPQQRDGRQADVEYAERRQAGAAPDIERDERDGGDDEHGERRARHSRRRRARSRRSRRWHARRSRGRRWRRARGGPTPS